MSGLIVLVVVGIWAAIGRWAWKNFLRPRVAASRVRTTGLAFAAAWFVLPVVDEILGAQQFKRLCAEIPPTRYYGPIAVGPGAFFDEEGRRKWRSSDEFARIRLATSDWNHLWEWRTDETRIATWPMIVFQARRLRIEKATGRIVNESYFRGSGGGWISRNVGGGQFGGYQCHSSGPHPNDVDSIRFDRNATLTARQTP